MKTTETNIQPPADLVLEVQKLKTWCPYRICWGAFRPEKPEDRLTGASYNKRQFNAALKAGYVGFSL